MEAAEASQPGGAGVSECSVCGGPSRKACAYPCGRQYCGKECQKRDWRNGHKARCDGILSARDFPIGELAKDALLVLMREVSVGSAMPGDKAMVYVEVADLDMRSEQIQVTMAIGHTKVEALVHHLVEVTGNVAKGGANEALLRSSLQGKNCVGAVVRVKKLSSEGQHFTVVGTNKLDSRLVTLRRIREGDATGATRITTTTYEGLKASGMGTAYFPLVLAGHLAPDSPAARTMTDGQNHSECVVCCDLVAKNEMVLSSCGHDVCCRCGMEWRRANGMYTCPICRLALPQFDSLYPGDLEIALIPQFHRTSCCWCGRMASYRCRCQLFEYCDTRCKDAHWASGHHQRCSNPWFLPADQQLPADSFWQWTGAAFEQRTAQCRSK